MIKHERFLPPVPGGFGAPVMRAGGFLLATLLCLSFFWPPANPFALKVVVAGVALLAAFRPAAAMLVLAGVVPFGRALSGLASPAEPVGITEALALAYLAGWALSTLRARVHDRPASPGLLLGYLFAAVVLASLIVDIGIYRYWKDYWYPFLGQLSVYLARDFLSVDPEFRPWAGAFGLPTAQAASIFVEGVALTRAAQALRAGQPTFGRRLLWTLAIAATGTAILSCGAAFQLANAEGRSLLSVFQTDRLAAHTSKINTAASYYVLFIPVVIGLGIGPARSPAGRPWVGGLRRAVATAGAGLLLAALWLTGTRAAMVAGVTVIAGAALCAAAMRGQMRHLTRRSAVAAVAAGVVVVALLGVGFYMRTARLEATSATFGSLPVRVLMWRAALKTIAARPAFGVGIGQFQYRVTEFDPEAVLPANVGASRFHAHNQFLQMAAELGLIGGMAFLGMVATILWRAWKAFRASHDAVLGGAIAGVVAFLITCLAGQPLFYNVVAFPFWMVLGVVLASGDASPAAIADDQTPAGRRLPARLFAGFLVVLALSIPVRVWQGKGEVNFALAEYGFSEWHRPTEGAPYRLVRDNGTFFTYPHALRLKLSIRRDAQAGQNRLDVDVSLDGRRARSLTLADNEWQSAEFIIPADPNRRFRRVDLSVRAPAGVAAQVRVAPAEITEDEAYERGRSR